MREMLLIVAVAGCANADPPVAKRIAPPVAICPAAPPAVPVPPPPRTFDTVIAFGRVTDARRQETVKALEVCRKSLERLARWSQEN